MSKRARTSEDHLTRMPSLAECERAIGEKAITWKGRCFEIASCLVKAGLVKGHAVYGHWRGDISKGSMFYRRASFGFVQHGWVVLAAGRIFDPTRWAFENVSPYLHVGPGDANEYDEGGNVLRRAMRSPPPPYDSSETRYDFTPAILGSAAWQHIEKLLRIDICEQEPGIVDASQLYWLANADYDSLCPYASEVYAAIDRLGRRALIPIDNLKRAEREKEKAS